MLSRFGESAPTNRTLLRLPDRCSGSFLRNISLDPLLFLRSLEKPNFAEAQPKVNWVNILIWCRGNPLHGLHEKTFPTSTNGAQ
jgi:hypothetical protein